ncbi:MAG: hypothetical protein R6V72_02525 [Cyclobacterium sp.]|uniref:HD domain-containing protein n=1 Tax=unclassified Cyclobacterium TaxID=2615055 RepID=UPI0013D7534A|nr:HD family phosphohydrolase [Cyclobacterium sp. SYSU L10401]
MDWESFFSFYRKRLAEGLPAALTYHNLAHTEYVIDMAEVIGRYECMGPDDLMLLKTGALFHDMGFIFGKEDHEAKACEIIEKELPEWDFSKEDIKKIGGMIMATKIPQRPSSRLEAILADADLEYLGTAQFDAISEGLYKEMRWGLPGLSRSRWLDMQIQFIKNHSYHTRFCRQYREPIKLQHLGSLIREKQVLSQSEGRLP